MREFTVEEIKTFLKSNSYVDQPRSTESDGVNYIELSKAAKTELGKMLCISHTTIYETPIGRFNSIKTFMEFITTPDYPIDIISKSKITAEDVNRIPKRKVGVPNYWALVAVAVYYRIKSDEYLQQKLKESTLPFTATTVNKSGVLFGTKVNLIAPNKKLGRYIGIVRVIREAIKADMFTEEFAKNLVDACKEDQDKGLFEGVPFVVYEKGPAKQAKQPEPTTDEKSENINE